MGLCIALADEDGSNLEFVTDDKNLLHNLLPPQDDDSNPMLASIDWYGDTVFNQLQIEPFLAEWERLQARAQSSEAAALHTRIKDLAERSKQEPRLYLKFYGD